MALPETIHTVTFDCWSTLIYEPPGQHGGSARSRLLAAHIGADEQRTSAAFMAAWRLHQTSWHQRIVFASTDMLQHTLQALGMTLERAAQAELLAMLEEDILDREVHAIAGARALLEGLRRAGARTALICDTGFTPGRVVRQLLQRHGLLDLLEITIFSDEIGVPKPHPRAFARALEALGTHAQGAVHVGDIRRTDIAGAKAAGMAAVRFRGHHDDAAHGSNGAANVGDCAAAGCNPVCDRPEADLVVDEYGVLAELLAPRLGS